MSTNDEPVPSIEDLIAELDDYEPVNREVIPDAPGEAMFAAADVGRLFTLVVAACYDSPGPYGKGLVQTLIASADVNTSSGTIYPILHDLEADGVLATQDLVRRTHYTIADTDAADAILADYEQRLAWWLALTRTAREALDVDADADIGTDPDADA